jgi:alpha-1,3-rhamnosyl/mannosyltransferase
VSQFTQREVADAFHVPLQKLIVIPHGTNAMPPADNSVRAGIVGPYWMTFGHQPHKNAETCLQALAERNRASKSREQVVIVGRSSHIDSVLKPLAAALGLTSQIAFVGRVSAAALRGLYEGALGLLFLSRYEGFGLPVLEAMGCGCPVICSNVCSLPEVVGDAGLCFGPDDVVSVAKAMKEISRDSVLRRQLTDAGRLRAASFTWDRAARETIKVYESLVNVKRNS